MPFQCFNISGLRFNLLRKGFAVVHRLILSVALLGTLAISQLPQAWAMLPEILVYSPAETAGSISLRPQENLQYALQKSTRTQQSIQLVQDPDLLLRQLMEAKGLAGQHQSILFLYGYTPLNGRELAFLQQLIRQEEYVILARHPMASLNEAVAWEDELQRLFNNYRTEMNTLLGNPEKSTGTLVDDVLSGTHTLETFPKIDLPNKCTLYPLPSPFMHCANGLPRLSFTVPKPPPPPAPPQASTVGKPAAASSQTPASSWASPSTTVVVLAPPPVPQPSYDVGTAMLALHRNWMLSTTIAAIRHRFAPFEEEANQLEREFARLQTHIWQRLQAFEVLGKQVSAKAETAQELTAMQRSMDSLKPLKGEHRYAEYRQQATRIIQSAMNMKQQLLFPSFPNEVHGVWFDRGSIVSLGSPAKLTERLMQLKESGMTDIFFETINAGYPIYPGSQFQPQQNPLISGWDPLEVAVREGHRLGLRVHAWVWCFAVGNTRHNALIGTPYVDIGPVLKLPGLAESTLKMNDGHLVPNGQHEYWLNPASYQGQEFLANWYAEIIERYDVDGLQLDYVRYPFQSRAQRAGYDALSRKNYQIATGNTLATGNESAAYTQWKTDNVSRFVSRVSKGLKEKKPDLIISAAVFTLPTEDRLQAIQQDWETWCKRGWIDWLVPMAYTTDDQELEIQAKRIQASLKPTRTQLVSGIGAHKLNTPERANRSEQLRMLGATGWTWFANAQLDVETLGLLARTTQSKPLGLEYRATLHQHLSIFAGVLNGTLKSSNTQEQQALAQWKQLLQFTQYNTPTRDTTFYYTEWKPLYEETQSVIKLRYAGVPALEEWLLSELERLDAQMRYTTL